MHTLAVNVVWDAHCCSGEGAASCGGAIGRLIPLLDALVSPNPLDGSLRPLVTWQGESEYSPGEEEWQGLLERCLRDLQQLPGDGGPKGERVTPPQSAIDVCTLC
jgi:hypothetical protein